jgi:hypothetical protein
MLVMLVISGASLLAVGSVAQAAGPAAADVEVCNREAYARTASPSATPPTDRDTATKPGTPVSPSAAPATKTPVTPPPAGTTRSDTDPEPGTPVSRSAAPMAEAPMTPSPAGASPSSDDTSRGMAATGQSDPAFRCKPTWIA